MRLFTKPRAFQAKTSISISGGTDNVRYYIAGGYLRKGGFFKTYDKFLSYDYNPSFGRYNFRTNLDIDVTPTTKLSLTSSGRFGSRVLFRGIGRTETWWKLYWGSPFGGAGIDNKGRVIDTGNYYIPGPKKDPIQDVYGNGYNRKNRIALNLALSGTQELNFITKGLSFRLKGAYNIYYTRNIFHSASVPIYEPFFKTDVDPSATGDSTIVFKKRDTFKPLHYSEGYNRDRDWYLEARLSYDRDFGRHSVEGLLMYHERREFYPNAFPGIPRGVVGMVARVNYNFDNRYFLQFSAGYNGSENFARDRRFGFLSGCFGWMDPNK